MKIKVLYNVEETDGIDMELDSKVQEFFESLGFESTGTGTDLRTSERDLCFERTEVNAQ